MSITPIVAVCIAAFGAAAASAAGSQQAGPAAPPVIVLPWDGRDAAVSLTFDDGDISHWQTAIPDLDAHGMKGTFFVIVGNVDNWDVWKKAQAEGHEIASHSMTHPHAAALTPEQIASETAGARQKLLADCGEGIFTFAYPYTEITPALEDAVRGVYIAGRGGWVPSCYLRPTDTPDWGNIPSQVTLTDTPLATYVDWIDQAEQRRAWTVFMIHGLEGTQYGYEPISRKSFDGILDRLRDPKIWVAPFGTVAAYWQAQKTLEASAAAAAGGRETDLSWTVPPNFPSGVMLKVSVPGASRRLRVSQGDTVLRADKDGLFTVAFDAGRLAIRR